MFYKVIISMSATLIKNESSENVCMITHTTKNYIQGMSVRLQGNELYEIQGEAGCDEGLYIITKIINNTTFILQKCRDQNGKDAKTRYIELPYNVINVS
jgi:hypothetical protein